MVLSPLGATPPSAHHDKYQTCAFRQKAWAFGNQISMNLSSKYWSSVRLMSVRKVLGIFMAFFVALLVYCLRFSQLHLEHLIKARAM